jgi:hypothetical protein
MGPPSYMRSVVDWNVIMWRIPVEFCVRCHDPHPMKIEKTFYACVLGSVGVVTQWYCREGEGHVVHNHYVESGGDPVQYTVNRHVNIWSHGWYKGSEHVKTIIKETDYLLQQLFNPDETGLKFKYETQAVTAPHKSLYTDTQKMEKQLNITSIFMKYSASLFTKRFIASDYCDNFTARYIPINANTNLYVAFYHVCVFVSP